MRKKKLLNGEGKFVAQVSNLSNVAGLLTIVKLKIDEAVNNFYFSRPF